MKSVLSPSLLFRQREIYAVGFFKGSGDVQYFAVWLYPLIRALFY